MRNLILLTAVSLLTLIGIGSVSAAGSININTSLALAENSEASNHTQSFQLSLTPAPSDTTTITFATNGQCTLSHAGQAYVTSGTVVSGKNKFDFSARAVADEAGEGAHSCLINFSAESEDPAFGSAQLDVVASVEDDTGAVFEPLINTRIISGSTLEEGSENIVAYELFTNREAGDPLRITAYGGPDCQLIANGKRVDSTEVVIASGQTVSPLLTLAARQDTEYEGLHSCIINHSLSTIDLTFGGVSISPLVVSVKDDDNNDLQNQRQADELNQLIDEINGRGVLDYYDANFDGTDDSEQANVQSFINNLSGLRQAIEVESCNIAGSVESLREHDMTADRSIHFPYGGLAFELECSEPGATATISWYLDQNYPADYPWLLRKIDSQGQITVVANAVFETVELQNGSVSMVSYQVTDGGLGDADGEVNGVIVDPVGLGLPIALLEGTGILARADVPISPSNAVFLSLLALAVILTSVIYLSRPEVQAWIDKKILSRIDIKKPRIDKY